MTDLLKKHLARWSYEGVDFPASESETEGGHDSAQHAGYLQAPLIQTTGPKAYHSSVQIPLHAGVNWPTPLFPDVYRALVKKLEDAPLGLLTHPTRGTFLAHADLWKERIVGNSRDGFTLTVQFTEQERSSELLDFSSGSQSDPGQTALAQAGVADALRPSGVVVATATVAAVSAAFDFLEAATRTRLQATGAFTSLLADLGARIADAAAADANSHAYRYALWRTRGAVLDYQTRYLGTRAPRRYTVPAAMSVQQIAAMAEVYGDPSRAAELLGANALRDPSEVPVGTVLFVVD